jgi:hypothetical protein
MMTMTVGHRIALWVVTSLVALMMVVVGPGVSAASADSAHVAAKHSGSGDGQRGGENSHHDKKHKKDKKDKGGGGGPIHFSGGGGTGGGGGGIP